jgi:cytoskeletal protein CcmA (bactofilin family)
MAERQNMETRPAPLPARRREEMPLTVISEGDVLVGRLSMAGNGQVLGSFDGDLHCAGELLVGSDARVQADIEAHHLVLAGHVHGNVVVRGRLKITTTGRLEGDAHVGSLVVQEGGVHFGLLRVYPDGLPERPEESVAQLAVATRPAGAGSRTRPLAASVDRVKKMWGEIF